MKVSPWVVVVVGAIVIGVAFGMTGAAPGEALRALAQGTFGSPNDINGTLRETTPLLIAGLAVFIALRAGLFNIGADGQLVVGALAGMVVALNVHGPMGAVLGVLAGVLMGALWALPVGLIKVYRHGHEVITTIMMNAMAGFFTAGLANGPFKAPNQQSATTANLPPAEMIRSIDLPGGVSISWGLVFGVLATIGLAYWFKRTVAGYELQATGQNPTAARFAGVNVGRVTLVSMIVSGAIAGLAGAVMSLGYAGRFYADFSPGYGFNALGVALLAGSHPLWLLPAAGFFGLLTKGASALQSIGIPRGISQIVLGVLIAAFAAFRYRKMGGRAED